jgi:hypothetical protein
VDVFQACRCASLWRGLLSAHRTMTRGQSHTTVERESSTSLVLFFSHTPQEIVLRGCTSTACGTGTMQVRVCAANVNELSHCCWL